MTTTSTSQRLFSRHDLIPACLLHSWYRPVPISAAEALAGKRKAGTFTAVEFWGEVLPSPRRLIRSQSSFTFGRSVADGCAVVPCKLEQLISQLDRILHNAQQRSLGDQYLEAQLGLACNGADPKNFDPDP